MFTWRPLGIDLMLLSLRWTTCYFDENYCHCSYRDDVVKSTYPENHFDGRHYRHNCHHHHHWTRPDIWNSPKTKIPNITVLGIAVTAGTTTNKAGARITSLAALWIVWLPWLPYSTYQYLDFQLLLCSMTKLEAHDREICHCVKGSTSQNWFATRRWWWWWFCTCSDFVKLTCRCHFAGTLNCPSCPPQ